jgi:hypothetical protein
MVLPPSVALLNRVFMNCASKKGLLLAILELFQAIGSLVGTASTSHVGRLRFRQSNYIFIFLFSIFLKRN